MGEAPDRLWYHGKRLDRLSRAELLEAASFAFRHIQAQQLAAEAAAEAPGRRRPELREIRSTA